jgi:hypothetical protein
LTDCGNCEESGWKLRRDIVGKRKEGGEISREVEGKLRYWEEKISERML